MNSGWSANFVPLFPECPEPSRLFLSSLPFYRYDAQRLLPQLGLLLLRRWGECGAGLGGEFGFGRCFLVVGTTSRLGEILVVVVDRLTGQYFGILPSFESSFSGIR
jgi:hypothetical protein